MLKQTIRHFLIYAFSKPKSQITFGFIRGAELLLSRYPKHSIFFENISAQKDGYGAQIQRILSIKSLANLVHQPFILNPLTEVEDQITQKTLSCEEKKEEISQFNLWLSDFLGSREEASDSFKKTIRISSPIELFFQSLRFSLLSRNKLVKIKFRLENAYFITNTNPDLYLSIIAPTTYGEADFSETKRIHVHFRFVNFSIGTLRSLDSDYYFKTLDGITTILDKEEKKYQIILHSDFSTPFDDSKNLPITQMTKSHLSEMRLIDSENKPDKKVLDSALNLLSAIHDRYHNVEFSKSQTPLSSLQSMASADFLILSKSSFAFVAGILNRRGEIHSPEYWINLPSEWITKSGF